MVPLRVPESVKLTTVVPVLAEPEPVEPVDGLLLEMGGLPWEVETVPEAWLADETVGVMVDKLTRAAGVKLRRLSRCELQSPGWPARRRHYSGPSGPRESHL